MNDHNEHLQLLRGHHSPLSSIHTGITHHPAPFVFQALSTLYMVCYFLIDKTVIKEATLEHESQAHYAGRLLKQR